MPRIGGKWFAKGNGLLSQGWERRSLENRHDFVKARKPAKTYNQVTDDEVGIADRTGILS